MLVGTVRELQAHAQQIRFIVATFSPATSLTGLCIPDRVGRVVYVRVGDNYGELASGKSQFATNLPGVLGSYFEVWTPSTEPDTYTLAKAYLHLHASSSPTETPHELIFIHTEPTNPNGHDDRQLRLARWRSGPHLHVKASGYGLGRCHIHLDSNTVPCPALESLAGYRESLGNMIGMLSDELLEYFDLSQVS